MHIALLTDGLYPYKTGGMQKHTLLLAKYWSHQGVSVDLVYTLPADFTENDDLDEHLTKEEKKNIRFIRVERPKDFYFPGHYIWTSYRISRNIAKVIKQQPETDFIYAQGFAGWQLIKEKKKGKKISPIGVNFHGLNMFQKAVSLKSQMEHFLFRPFVRYNLQHADYALSLGGGITDIIFKEVRRNTRVIESPNGIDGEWLKNGEYDIANNHTNKRRFVFIGRYERIKGVQELNSVLQRLSTDGGDFYFDVVGPIPENLKINLQNVNYWGLIREENKIQSILQKADVLVCPSYSEGMPTVILEAMGSGCAIVATDVGAVDTLVAEDNGWLIPPGDKDRLLEAMKQAIAIGDQELQQKKEISRHRVEGYTWENIAEQTLNNIKEAIN
jgi:glycosyltransferase involved in cell wall biosynthesis